MKQRIKTVNVEAEVSSIPAGVRNQGDWLRSVTGDLSIPDNASFSFSGRIVHKFGQPQLLIPRIDSTSAWGIPAPVFFDGEGQIADFVAIDSPVYSPSSLNSISVAKISGILSVYSGEEFSVARPASLQPIANQYSWSLRDLKVSDQESGIASVRVLTASYFQAVTLRGMVVPQGLAVVAALNTKINLVRMEIAKLGWTKIGAIDMSDVNTIGTSADLWAVPRVTNPKILNAWYVGVHSVKLKGLVEFDAQQKSDTILAAELISRTLVELNEVAPERIKRSSVPVIIPNMQSDAWIAFYPKLDSTDTQIDVFGGNGLCGTSLIRNTQNPDPSFASSGDKVFVLIQANALNSGECNSEVTFAFESADHFETLNALHIHNGNSWTQITSTSGDPYTLRAHFGPSPGYFRTVAILEFDAAKLLGKFARVFLNNVSGPKPVSDLAISFVWTSNAVKYSDFVI